MGRVVRLGGLVLGAALLCVALGGRASAGGCGSSGTPTTTVYLPNITKTLGGTTGWVTPFIVQNIGASTTTLELSFYRFTDGALVTCRQVSGLLPGTSFADVPNEDADLPDDSQFAVVIRSFGSEVVSVVNEHQGSGARAESLSYVGSSAGARTVHLPYISKLYRGWLTTFIVQNFGPATANVTISLKSYDGLRSVTILRQMGPGRSTVVDPTVEAAIDRFDELSATVTADQPVGVVVNAHNDDPTVAAPRAFSYNGVPGGTWSQAYLPYIYKEDLEFQGQGDSQVAIQNAGSADATPTLTFRQLGSGSLTTISAPGPVKPGEVWSFDRQIFKVQGGYQLCRNAGAGKCISPGEHALVVSGGQFAVLERSLTPSTATGFTAQTGPLARSYLPNVTRTLGGANGWTTPIIVQSAGATAATLRWYRFADGALVQTQQLTGLSSGGGVKIDPRTVSGLAESTQYAVVVDGTGGDVAAVVSELNFQGGDGVMTYEGFPRPPTYTLSGTIRGVGGAPLGSAAANLYTSGGAFVGSRTTGPTGQWSFVGVAPGLHRLWLIAPPGSDYVREWWNDRPGSNSADLIDITADRQIDATLEIGLRLSGRVTDAEGRPIPGVTVDVRGDADSSFTITAGNTDGDGRYNIALRAGTYSLFFFAPAGYVSEWWNDRTSVFPHLGPRDPLAVTAALIIDAVLARQ